jgi:carboxyl-terminal processing protease
VAVADKFLEKGRLVVSTKGRDRGQNNDYYSNHDPVIPVDMPMVILVNKASASASEIVAGAIQDWDRGLIVGTVTFGKGSVQTVFPISENSALKLTTAYYYTPSGRCINIEHSPKQKEKPKELFDEQEPQLQKKQFTTHNGRAIYGGGGITPDLEVESKKLDNLLLELLRRRMLFGFAVHYVSEHSQIDQNFEVDDQVLALFKDFLKQKQFDYKTPEEIYVDTLKVMVQEKGYNHRTEGLLAELEIELEKAKENDFQKDKDYIKMAIRKEIASRQWGLEAGIRATFPEDAQLHKAIDILRDPVHYPNIRGKETGKGQRH